MQLVNQPCVHCRERVTRDPDGRFCPKCGSVVHHACAERAKAASPSGCCRGCGAPAPVLEQAARTRKEQQKAADATRAYQMILGGVAMMIGGILSSMCCTGLTGGQVIVVASGAIFGGVVLVAVGFLQSARR